MALNSADGRFVHGGWCVLIGATVVLHPPQGAAQCPMAWRSAASTPGFNGEVYTLGIWDPDGEEGPEQALLIAGGNFSRAGNTSIFSIAAWNGRSWIPMGNPIGTFGTVYSLTVYDGKLIASGLFGYIGGQSIRNVAEWNGHTWSALLGGVNGQVYASLVYNNRLVVGGTFTMADELPAYRVAQWDGAAWTPISHGMYDDVRTLAVHQGELVAGGYFTAVDGMLQRFISRWDGRQWHELGGGVNFPVHSLLSLNGDLYVGGAFTAAGGQPARRIAKWDGSNWQAMGLGFGGTGFAPNNVRSIVVYDDALYAAGVFTHSGDDEIGCVAKWSGTNWESVGGGVGPWADSAIVFNGELVVCGYIQWAGLHPANYIARFGPDCRRGDMNCDGVIDETDVPLLVDAVLNAPGISTCASYTANVRVDVHSDGTPKINGHDLVAFVDCYLNDNCP